MNSGRPIVVGVDGSTAGAEALRWAVAEAASSGRDVVAVTAWNYTLALDPGARQRSVEEVAAAHRHGLRELVGSAAGRHPGVKIRCQVVEGEADEVLLEASRDAAMLVLGSHGHRGFMRALVGSVSGHCLRHASCPVVIIPALGTRARSRTALANLSYLPGPTL
jgi:nucleotide-binding universal stress UspA family protein